MPSSFDPAGMAVRPETSTSRETRAVTLSSTFAVSLDTVLSRWMPMTEFSVTVSSSNRGLAGSFTGAGAISSGGGGGGGSSAAGVGTGVCAGTVGALAGTADGDGAVETTAGGFAGCCGRAFASDRPELVDLGFGAAGSLAGSSTAGSAGAGTAGVGVTIWRLHRGRGPGRWRFRAARRCAHVQGDKSADAGRDDAAGSNCAEDERSRGHLGQ